MFRILSGQLKPAVLFIAAVASIGTASVAHAGVTDVCFNFLRAQDYPRAVTEAKSLLKRKGLAREDERAAQLCLGRTHRETGRFRDALPAFLRVEALSRTAEELGIAYNWLGLTYENVGEHDRAELYTQRAIKASKELGDKSKEASNLNNLALIVQARGDLDRALSLYRESLVLEPDEAKKATMLNNIALIHSGREEYAEATKLLRQALDIERRQGNGHQIAIFQLNLGTTLRSLGDLASAERELTAGLKAIQLIGDKDWESSAYRYLGELRFQQHRLAEAKDLTRKAIELSKANGTVDETAVSNLDFFNKQ